MSRAERLLDLIQCLRGHRLPVSGQCMADELGVSLRTIYRDIATLQAQGADIEGEAGIGYVLKPGFLLPPLMFSEEEIEALVLGSRWVAERTDGDLAKAAAMALSKIAAVLPPELKTNLENTTLLVAGSQPDNPDIIDLAVIRQAIRREQSLDIQYQDLKGEITQRRIWPFAIGFFERVRVAVAWCEMRKDFRHFRTDRMMGVIQTHERYPKRRLELLKTWRAREKIAK